MPLYDLRCDFCGHEIIDRMEKVHTAVEDRGPCPGCSAIALQRAWLTKPSAVIGDECDITIRHGLCNPDGTPHRYTLKSDIFREAKRRGLVNRVEHVGSPGSDRNRKGNTTRWV